MVRFWICPSLWVLPAAYKYVQFFISGEIYLLLLCRTCVVLRMENRVKGWCAEDEPCSSSSSSSTKKQTAQTLQAKMLFLSHLFEFVLALAYMYEYCQDALWFCNEGRNPWAPCFHWISLQKLNCRTHWKPSLFLQLHNLEESSRECNFFWLLTMFLSVAQMKFNPSLCGLVWISKRCMGCGAGLWVKPQWQTI